MASITPAVEHDIMEATRRELASVGFVDLGLESVALAAEVSPQLVRREYDSTADLGASFVEYERDRLAEFLMTASDDPRAHLRELLELTVGLTELDADELVPAYREMYGRARHHEQLREALDAFEADIHAALTEAVREGVEAGAFRDCEPEAVATMIFAAREAVVGQRALGVDDTYIRDALDQVVLSQVRVRPAADD
jgi:AcrR family transcriptional regulator